MSAWGTRNFARNSAKILSLLLLAVVAALPALAQDTQPPVLTSFTFAPMAVNTTTGPATVTVTAQATDDLSGVTSFSVGFANPAGQQVQGCSLSLISGTNLNGTWQCQFTIPAFVEGGTWYVSYLYLADNVGNSDNYNASQLQALGFPTNLQVTSQQDTLPPVLTSFTFAPMAVNTTTGPATVTVTAQATDDLSGVTSFSVGFANPAGQQVQGCGLSLISGTNLNGTWQCQFTIPAFVEGGTWYVSYLYLADSVGNSDNYNASQLQALGFPTNLQVTSQQDALPPVLTSFTFAPMAVNTTTGPATVTVTAQATDDLSGVTSFSVGFANPAGQQVQGCGLSLISGTNLNGTWQCQFTIPAYSQAGTWSVSYLYLADSVGNSDNYNASQLQALGFPTQLIVDSSTTVVLTSSVDPSSYEQSVTFTATATSSNGITPTGTVNFNDGSTTIGSGTLNASGVTTFTTSSLALGSHTIVAAYLGDSNDPAADSSPLIQTVNQAATTTKIASSKNPQIIWYPVTFTATVSFAGGIPPDGDAVEFFDGQAKLGVRTLKNGAATLNTTELKAGVHLIWAKYLGDANLQASKSPPLRQVMNPGN